MDAQALALARLRAARSGLLLAAPVALAGLGASCRAIAPEPSPSAPASIWIVPAEITLAQGESHAFRAEVEGLPPGAELVWSVTDSRGQPSPGGGTITPEGVYTPGGTIGKWFYVRATSAADPNVSGVAQVEVIVAGAPKDGRQWHSLDCRSEGRPWTLLYHAEAEGDVKRLYALLEQCLSELRATFASRGHDLVLGDTRLAVYVHHWRDARAGEGTMTIETRSADDGAGRVAELHLLAPSAHRGASPGGWAPGYDQRYFHKNLAHELATLPLERLTHRKASGWRFHDAPDWFVQGIEEFLGCTLAQDGDRLARYVRACAADPARVGPTFDVREVYGDGCALLAFLDQRYGRERQLDLLESEAADFWSAVREVLGTTPEELHGQWSSWIESQAQSSATSPPDARAHSGGG